MNTGGRFICLVGIAGIWRCLMSQIRQGDRPPVLRKD